MIYEKRSFSGKYAKRHEKSNKAFQCGNIKMARNVTILCQLESMLDGKFSILYK